jgi:hypothetical protein
LIGTGQKSPKPVRLVSGFLRLRFLIHVGVKQMKRRTFLSAVSSGLVAAAGSSLPKAVLAAGTSEPIKLGLLFSQSGTMANGESLLKDTALMTIDQINAKGRSRIGLADVCATLEATAFARQVCGAVWLLDVGIA